MRFPGRKSSPSGDKGYRADHAGLGFERHRAGNVLAIRSPVVKHVDTAELRIVVAVVLAIPADAVLVSHHLPELGADLVTALARLHVRKLATRSRLEAGERRNARNSVSQFANGNKKCRWNARAYPKREYIIFFCLSATELRTHTNEKLCAFGEWAH
jgi:hypothetical protein